MKLVKCFLTENDCYKANVKIAGNKPVGIVVHSTGANNPYLKRYVYSANLLSKLGVNKYNNHWNRSGLSKCVHAFIGKDASGNVLTCHTLPFDVCCWGAGRGSKGSYNYNPNACIQFEICEDALVDREYFNKVFKEAAEFCAYICKQFNLPVSSIRSHAEAHKAGYASNHSDCDHWLRKFGKTMNDFRNDVAALLAGGNVTSSNTVTAQQTPTAPYIVKVTADELNIRSGPGTNYGVVRVIKNKGAYTIVDEKAGKGSSIGWGKLKSGAGWISLDFTRKL